MPFYRPDLSIEPSSEAYRVLWSARETVINLYSVLSSRTREDWPFAATCRIFHSLVLLLQVLDILPLLT